MFMDVQISIFMYAYRCCGLSEFVFRKIYVFGISFSEYILQQFALWKYDLSISVHVCVNICVTPLFMRMHVHMWTNIEGYVWFVIWSSCSWEFVSDIPTVRFFLEITVCGRCFCTSQAHACANICLCIRQDDEEIQWGFLRNLYLPPLFTSLV